MDDDMQMGDMAMKTIGQWLIPYTRLDTGYYVAIFTALDKINRDNRRRTACMIAGFVLCMAICAVRYDDPIPKLLSRIDAATDKNEKFNEYERLQTCW